MQSFWFPTELVVLAGELGISIEISAYSDAFFESKDTGDGKAD